MVFLEVMGSTMDRVAGVVVELSREKDVVEEVKEGSLLVDISFGDTSVIWVCEDGCVKIEVLVGEDPGLGGE